MRCKSYPLHSPSTCHKISCLRPCDDRYLMLRPNETTSFEPRLDDETAFTSTKRVLIILRSRWWTIVLTLPQPPGTCQAEKANHPRHLASRLHDSTAYPGRPRSHKLSACMLQVLAVCTTGQPKSSPHIRLAALQICAGKAVIVEHFRVGICSSPGS